MRDQNPSIRKAFVSTVFAGFLLLFAAVSSVHAQSTDCQTELDGTSGFTTLSNGASTSQTNSVVEWDGEVLKLQTNSPGVITLSATGSGSQGSLYTAGSGETHPLLDSSTLGASQRDLKTVVGAGYHCVELAPDSGATGDIQLVASFQSVCPLGSSDDHGDSFLCATPITVDGDAISGEITSSGGVDDVDMFVFTLSSSATVTIASTGDGEDGGRLYDSTGSVIASDNTGWSSSNFSITQSLAAGTYYVQVSGPNSSSYEVSVSTP